MNVILIIINFSSIKIVSIYIFTMTKRILVPVAESCEDVELAGLTDVLVRGGNKVTLASVTSNKIVTLS